MTNKEKLLALLEDSKGMFFSGEEIARTLQVSRAAVWKAVNALREDGYTIDAVTNKGYRLSPDSDILSPQGIRRFLKPEYRDLNLTVLPTVPSTNALVREKANQGCPEGCVIIAREQTAGRGRYGRQFFSPADTGVYLSLLLRPTAYSPRQATCLTAAAAAAMCQAIEAVTGQHPGIKWVNDIFLHGKKVCGILTEAGTDLESGRLEWLVVGIGLNLTSTAADWPPELADKAGSLYPGGPAPVPRAALAGAIARELLALGPGEDCLDEYRARCFVPGHWVTVCTGSETYAARALAIDDAGRLVVRRENGREEALRCGEVTTRPARTE